MTERHLLKLLEMVASKVRDTQSKYPVEVWGDEEQWNRSAERAFGEVKATLESLQCETGACRGPFSEELPEEASEAGWGWRIYGCANHAHVIHLKFGYVLIERSLAERILALGCMP